MFEINKKVEIRDNNDKIIIDLLFSNLYKDAAKYLDVKEKQTPHIKTPEEMRNDLKESGFTSTEKIVAKLNKMALEGAEMYEVANAKPIKACGLHAAGIKPTNDFRFYVNYKTGNIIEIEVLKKENNSAVIWKIINRKSEQITNIEFKEFVFCNEVEALMKANEILTRRETVEAGPKVNKKK